MTRCQLNADHSAISVGVIVTFGNPRPAGTLARSSADHALSVVQRQHHTGLRPGAAPELVYFAGDARAQETGKVTWTAGGESALDPMWLIPGVDGRDYFVGASDAAYYLNQLPFDQEA
jgi:hypothetical protein